MTHWNDTETLIRGVCEHSEWSSRLKCFTRLYFIKFVYIMWFVILRLNVEEENIRYASL